jgi:hypothetical protein
MERRGTNFIPFRLAEAGSLTFLGQAALTALAKGRSTIEERLARWLIQADDPVDNLDTRLTHEYLARSRRSSR